MFRIGAQSEVGVDAAFNRDYTMILGTVLFYATLILILNIVSDLMLVWLDPRLRDA